MTQPTVLFVQATDAAAYPPLLNAAGILADNGWRCAFLNAPTEALDLRFPPDSQHRVIAFPTRPSHVWTRTAYFRYCLEAWRQARALRPDVVYASDPIGTLPGVLAARTAGAGLVYHEHDSASAKAMNPLVRRARHRAMSSALRIVFPNAGRATHCLAELGLGSDCLHVVWNVPRRGEVPRTPNKRDGLLIVHYHGTVGPDLLPWAAAEAVARLAPRAILRIVGYEAPSARGYVRDLEARFGAFAAGGIIEFRGQVSRAELLRLAAQADIGLALMPAHAADLNLRCLAGASNKVFDYMAAGLPAIVSDLPDWREIFVAPGHAFEADPDSADSIGHALSRLAKNPALREEIGRRNRARILARWNYETAFAPVLAAMTQAIGKASLA